MCGPLRAKTAAQGSGSTCPAVRAAAFVLDGRRAPVSSAPHTSTWSPAVDRSPRGCARGPACTRTHAHTRLVTPANCCYLLMEKATRTTRPKEMLENVCEELIPSFLSLHSRHASASTARWVGTASRQASLTPPAEPDARPQRDSPFGLHLHHTAQEFPGFLVYPSWLSVSPWVTKIFALSAPLETRSCPLHFKIW